MIGRTVSVLLLAAACLQRAMAQPIDDGLDATQKQGRQLLAQSWCAHLRPAAVQGNRRWQRRRDGTPRMPGFKHYLGRAEIDAIIRILPTPLFCKTTPRFGPPRKVPSVCP